MITESQNRPDNRWEMLSNMNDAREIWQAIGWNGIIGDNKAEERPSDEDFKQHFEKLLSPPDAEPIFIPPPGSCPYIPVTDDPISEREVQEAIKVILPNKSGGPSGVPPGLLKAMPRNWIIFLAMSFSIILNTAIMPARWAYARLVVLYKKGSRLYTGNYRGIAVMDTFAKLFDIILCKRLERWFKPEREQAGAQRGRSCLEHIMTLRLAIDYAKSKNQKLYVVFVDFVKAYDKVPRGALIRSLIKYGCGYTMILAIATMYSNTSMVLGAAIISATLGVRQGSPTSCFLITCYLNDLVRDMKQCPMDGFLRWIHCLLLMDDTVLLATTREECRRKVRILYDFCQRSGMEMNQTKTKFM